MGNHYKGENGVSMVTFRVTKKMREQASDGVYRLTKEERQQIVKQNKETKERKKEQKELNKEIHTTTYA